MHPANASFSSGFKGDFTMQSKLVMASLCALLVITGLNSCGKRGDPYRPSEIPAKQTNS
tara:strand:+ start:605 stop:781 length:177 start_codon:yes stop_codon:yes gene_type:complete